MLSKTSPRNTCSCIVTDIKISNDPGHKLATKVRVHKESKILTTLTIIILCHVSQRKFEKCTKNRGAPAEPSFLLMNPFLFGCVLVA